MSSRNTRARSRANAGSGTPGSRQPASSEPPSADLPGLYPMHDGSYGVNTHVNLDNVRRRRGRKPKSDLVTEDDEDRRFTRRMRGKDGSRFNMENDLQKVTEETVEEARRDERGDGEFGDEEMEHGEDLINPNASIPPLASHIPTLSGQRFYPDPDNRGTRPHDTTQYRSAEPDSLINNRSPSAPVTNPTPFFGSSSGIGYPNDGTLLRPSSSKSFIGEGTLYGDASVYTPQPKNTPQPGDTSQPKSTLQPPSTQSQPKSTSAPTAPTALTGPTGPTGRGSFAPGPPSGLASFLGPDQPTPRWETFELTSSQQPGYEQSPYEPFPFGKSPYEKSTPKEPTYEEPTYEKPAYEKPTYEQPTYEQPTFEDVTFDEPTHEEPEYEQPEYEQPAYEQPAYEQPAYEQPMSQQFTPQQPQATNLVHSSNEGLPAKSANASANGSGSIDKGDGAIQDSSRNSIPKKLSPEEWSTVTNFIQGMRKPSNPQSKSQPPGFTTSLDHLSPAEIQATKSLIRGMGKDPVTVASIIDELDRAANLAGPPKPSTLRPFANQSSSSAKVAETTNTPDQFMNNFPGVTDQALGPFLQDGGAVDGNGYDDSEYLAALKAAGRSAGRPGPVRPTPKKPPQAVDPQQVPLPKSTRPSRRKRNSWTRWIADKWDAILVFLTILTGVWVFLTFINHGPLPVEDDYLDRPQWLQWDTVRDNVLQVIPSGIRHPLRTFQEYTSTTSQGSTGASAGILGDPPSQFAENLAENLAPRIPEQVFVQRDKSGRLKISQDFWHALRELMREDDIILTLERARKEAPAISDAHWLAIRNRLTGSRLLQPANATAGSVPDAVDPTLRGKHCEECWNKWVGKNKEALRRAVSGVAVTKEEFMDLFKKEAQSRAQDINSALSDVNNQIQQLHKDVAGLRDSAPGSPNVSKAEIAKICDAAIKKAIRDIKLSAIAEGQIRSHANDMFANQINFFGVGSGAVIDPTYSSKPWEIPRGYYKIRSKQWYQRDGWTTQPLMQALSPWSEEGQCFCAGPKAWGLREETASVHVMMSRDIIPQNLVVEHILPGSTLDPGAMPREIEVWAYIEEITLRGEVRVFSEINFPPVEPERTLNEAYVKVGQFVYENKTTGDGVQVFKLSDELAHMRAHTSSIVVRAISNYGADHTCFYRLRMYGEIVETEPWKEWGGRE